MKVSRFIAIVCVCMIAALNYSVAQTSAHDYFNKASQEYIHGKEQEALITTKRALEIFENDKKLQDLYNILQQQDENKDNKNSSNDNSSDQSDDSNKQDDNSSDSGDDSQSQDAGDDSKQNKDDAKDDSPDKNDSKGDDQQSKSDQEQGDEESKNPQSEGDDSDKNMRDKIGEISELEAEMLLQSLEQDDKKTLDKVNKQLQLKQRSHSVEKNW